MNTIQINKPGNSTIVAVIINTGAIHEDEFYKGISHFVEHTCFKGNLKRNQKQISSAIDNVGGDLNAYTDNELTVYWAKVGNTYKNLAIDVIVDLATKPLFPEKECEKERDVIIQELKMYEDKAEYKVYDLFSQAVYQKHSPFYLPIVGTKESLYRITSSQLLQYHTEKYCNPVLLIIGDVENKVEIENSLDNHYISAELNTNATDVYEERESLTQANILIGNVIEIYDIYKIEQIFYLKLLRAVYSGMSGRLFDVIREQNNLVYRVHFSESIYHNHTLCWVVSMGLNKENINKARELTIKELQRPVSKEDLEIALAKAIGTEEMALDNVNYIQETIANALVRDIDYRELIFNYKKHLCFAKYGLNQFIEKIRFDKNIVAGVIPKK